MEPLDGPLVRYPLGRTLFLAHRTAATGRLRLFDGENTLVVRLRDGLVSEVEGIENLLGSLPVEVPEHTNIDATIGLAMAAGQSYEHVLKEISRSVGRNLATWCLAELGMLSFKLDDGEQSGNFALQQNLVATLSRGLQAAGSARLGQQVLDAQPQDPVSVLMPRNASEGKLGLDALSLRVLNLANTRPALQDLVAHASKGRSARRREVLHRVFLLRQLGLLHLPESATPTEEITQSIPRRRSRPKRGGKPPAGRGRRSVKNSDLDEPSEHRVGGPKQRIAKLEKRAEALRPMNFYQRLGLGDITERPLPNKVDEAFHKLSKRYHPDAHNEAGPQVRSAAEEVFALLSEAIEGLRKKRVADEQWERNRCAQQGIPYVTDRDRTKARMSFKKGERLFRNKDYPIAEACFHEAATKDPLTPIYTYWHAYSAFLAKQMPADKALDIIRQLKAEGTTQASEFQLTMGRIVQLSGGAPEVALGHFRKAFEYNPENRDAQRELRLHEMRSDEKDKKKGRLAGLLGRFGIKSKKD